MKNIDKIFKDQLNQPQNPPAGAWDFIQSALDGENDESPRAIYGCLFPELLQCF